VYSKVPKADTYVLLGPNHHGQGAEFSVAPEDEWQTPLGSVTVDPDVAGAIADSEIADFDASAHGREHSIEVQLPFLQTLYESFEIVPVAIKHGYPDKGFLEGCKELAKTVEETIKNSDKRIVIIASSDMTHYEPQEVAEKKDAKLIRAIESLDEEAIFETVRENRITACGYGGIAAMVSACKGLGGTNAENVEYMTSGDVTGEKSGVVGYGGLVVY
jgi:hypothetical protein